MIEFDSIIIDKEWNRISVSRSGSLVDMAMRNWVDELAEETIRMAKFIAPLGPTGELKRHGVIRHDNEFTQLGDYGVPGSLVTSVAAFGGGFSVRGGNIANRGRFSAATKVHQPGFTFSGGRTSDFYEAVIELNPAVKHAKWVHEGTGIHGPLGQPYRPRTQPYMIFHYKGHLWHKKSVQGQEPQPFLSQAFEYVNDVYKPARLTQLRAQISAVT